MEREDSVVVAFSVGVIYLILFGFGAGCSQFIQSSVDTCYSDAVKIWQTETVKVQTANKWNEKLWKVALEPPEENPNEALYVTFGRDLHQMYLSGKPISESEKEKIVEKIRDGEYPKNAYDLDYFWYNHGTPSGFAERIAEMAAKVQTSGVNAILLPLPTKPDPKAPDMIRYSVFYSWFGWPNWLIEWVIVSLIIFVIIQVSTDGDAGLFLGTNKEENERIRFLVVLEFLPILSIIFVLWMLFHTPDLFRNLWRWISDIRSPYSKQISHAKRQLKALHIAEAEQDVIKHAENILSLLRDQHVREKTEREEETRKRRRDTMLAEATETFQRLASDLEALNDPIKALGNHSKNNSFS